MLTCVVNKDTPSPQPTNDTAVPFSAVVAETVATPAAAPNPALDTISNIFGGAEVIES